MTKGMGVTKSNAPLSLLVIELESFWWLEYKHMVLCYGLNWLNPKEWLQKLITVTCLLSRNCDVTTVVYTTSRSLLSHYCVVPDVC